MLRGWRQRTDGSQGHPQVCGSHIRVIIIIIIIIIMIMIIFRFPGLGKEILSFSVMATTCLHRILEFRYSLLRPVQLISCTTTDPPCRRTVLDIPFSQLIRRVEQYKSFKLTDLQQCCTIRLAEWIDLVGWVTKRFFKIQFYQKNPLTIFEKLITRLKPSTFLNFKNVLKLF